MKHYAGIDVSLNSSSVCVVDESGKIVREVKVPSEPVALIHCIKSLGVRVERIGLEAGPLSQWLYGALRESGLPVELLETRHVKAALSVIRSDASKTVLVGHLLLALSLTVLVCLGSRRDRQAAHKDQPHA